MKTKKIVTILLALAMTATIATAVSATTQELPPTTAAEAVEPAQMDDTMQGIVESFDLENSKMTLSGTNLGDVIVHITPEALASVGTLYPGTQVTITTNGIATMSLPAQVTALEIQTITFSGTIEGFDNGMLLVDGGDAGKIAVHVEDGVYVVGLENFKIGASALVYYDGIMTRSIPGQVNAQVLHILADEA